MDEQVSNIRIERPQHRIITPIGVEFNAGELCPVIQWELRDSSGKLVNTGIKKSDSLLSNFLKLLYVMFECQPVQQIYGVVANRTKLAVVDTAGISYLPGYDPCILNSEANIGITTLGMVVGTGNAPVAFNDNNLGTKINHGVGAGQLQYSVSSWGAPTSDGTTSQFRATRVFSNGSGAPINVNEAGMICSFVRGWYSYVNQDTTNVNLLRYALILRDILPGAPVAVPNGNSLTVNYQLQAVV